MQRLAAYQKENELVRRLSARSLPRRRRRVDVAVGFLALLLPCRDKPGLRRDRPSLWRDKPSLCRDRPSLWRDKPGLCRDRPGLCRDKPSLRRDKPGLCRTGRTPTPAKPILRQLL